MQAGHEHPAPRRAPGADPDRSDAGAPPRPGVPAPARGAPPADGGAGMIAAPPDLAGGVEPRASPDPSRGLERRATPDLPSGGRHGRRAGDGAAGGGPAGPLGAGIARLQALFQRAPGFVCILLGPDHRIEFANAACIRLFGERRLWGNTAREAFPELESRGLHEILDGVYASGERFVAGGLTLVLGPSPEGAPREIVLDVVYEPMLDAAGRVTGIFVEGHEVAPRAHAEAALQRSEAKYRSLFDAVDEGLCILDVLLDEHGRAADCRFLEVNRSFERQTGLRNATGRTVRELVPDIEPLWLETCGRVATGGEPARFVDFVGQLGRWFDACVFRIGEPREHRVAVLFDDITERTRIDEELREADRHKDEFLAMLAHELRNPLAPIRNACALLEREPMTERGRQALGISRRQLQQLTRLVDDLLEVSRVKRGLIELRIESVMLQHVVYAAAEAVDGALAARGQHVAFEMPQRAVRLNADPVRVAQIVENLMTNASKYSDPGSEIVVRVLQDEDWATVEVQDDGIGIAPENLSRVFSLFTQVAPSIDRPNGGLGIGLALVRRLVELHEGRVAVHSDGLGTGATFTVRLPLETPGGAPD
jgi:signal transduction histidine kinase